MLKSPTSAQSAIDLVVISELKEALKTSPELFDMGSFTHCIAGRALMLFAFGSSARYDAYMINDRNGAWVIAEARKLLGLSSEKLFAVYEWPVYWRRRYTSAKHPRSRVQIAIAAIDDYLKNREWSSPKGEARMADREREDA